MMIFRASAFQISSFLRMKGGSPIRMWMSISDEKKKGRGRRMSGAPFVNEQRHVLTDTTKETTRSSTPASLTPDSLNDFFSNFRKVQDGRETEGERPFNEVLFSLSFSWYTFAGAEKLYFLLANSWHFTRSNCELQATRWARAAKIAITNLFEFIFSSRHVTQEMEGLKNDFQTISDGWSSGTSFFSCACYYKWQPCFGTKNRRETFQIFLRNECQTFLHEFWRMKLETFWRSKASDMMSDS